MKITISGDFAEIGKIHSLIISKHFNEFNELKRIFADQDYNIINFEFPIIENELPIEKSGPHLRGGREAVELLKYCKINVCTLSNNHILDYGEKSCLKTERILNDENIQTVGVGRNISDARRALILDKEGVTVGIINCCEHEFSVATNDSAGANPLNPINQYYDIQELRKKCNYVLVLIHGGSEYFNLPSPRMKELYRFFIDVGADVVINNHQHCFSGYELYKDKLIVYGLGNFLFDKLNPELPDSWEEGYSLQLILDAKGIQFNLIPFLQCKGTFVWRILTSKEHESFNKTINKLNTIIINDKQLQEAYEKWVKKNEKEYLRTFEPYNSRIFNALYYRGLLPSFLAKRRLLRIYNMINCESHLDRLRLCIKNKLQKHVYKKN